MDFGNSYQRKYQCFVCGQIFNEYNDMKNHIVTTHEQGREWIKCPITYCGCPVRDLRVHFKNQHPNIPIPKNCQLRSSVWYDQTNTGRKKKISFAEGNFISKKNGGASMHYRSGWELKVYKILEEMHEVMNYRVEPFSIPYFFEGKERNYIPDLLVNFVDGTRKLFEIKPRNQLGVEQIKAKKLAAEQYCLARGISYEMITEITIEKLTREVNNRKFNSENNQQTPDP